MPVIDKVPHARLELWVPIYNVKAAGAGAVAGAAVAVLSHSGEGECGAVRRHARAGPPGPRARGLRVVIRRGRMLVGMAMAALVALVVEYGE